MAAAIVWRQLRSWGLYVSIGPFRAADGAVRHICLHIRAAKAPEAVNRPTVPAFMSMPNHKDAHAMSPTPFRTLCTMFMLTLMLAGALATPVQAAPIYNFAPVTAEMQSFVQTYTLDGASLRVNKAGSVVYRRAFGGYTLGTRVRIASASKWLSALTIARVVEKGQLRWSDTLGQYFSNIDKDKRNITLEQLFSHTSALPGGDDACMSNQLYTLATCANRILQAPLIGEPGKVFSYGGNSMQVAGRMAEIATGKAWDDIFIDEMVTPLNLNATDFATSSTTPGYVRNDNPRIAGGARSTLEDYGKLVDTVLAYGCLDTGFPNQCLPGRRFLSRITIEFMARDRTVGTADVSRPGTSMGYGYGIGRGSTRHHHLSCPAQALLASHRGWTAPAKSPVCCWWTTSICVCSMTSTIFV